MADGAAAFAPAKVNLYLHVTGRRDNSYHTLDSLIAFAGVGDDVAVSSADDLSLTIDGPRAGGVPTGAENLVLRAAVALAEVAGIAPRAAIRLTKRLPAAAGIGGGSTDAAAALLALDRLWGLDLAAPELRSVGLSLGADVPVCLAGRPCFVGGIGEALDPVPPLPACWMVLANPGVATPTAPVFAARRGPFSVADRFAESPRDAAALAALLASRRNDLEAPARELVPAIGDVLAALGAQPGALLARMSGSGATCFALFAGASAARAGAAALAMEHPRWWIAPAPLLAAPKPTH